LAADLGFSHTGRDRACPPRTSGSRYRADPARTRPPCQPGLGKHHRAARHGRWRSSQPSGRAEIARGPVTHAVRGTLFFAGAWRLHAGEEPNDRSRLRLGSATTSPCAPASLVVGATARAGLLVGTTTPAGLGETPIGPVPTAAQAAVVPAGVVRQHSYYRSVRYNWGGSRVASRVRLLLWWGRAPAFSDMSDGAVATDSADSVEQARASEIMRFSQPHDHGGSPCLPTHHPPSRWG
jgi:hypothetical protein